MHTRRNGKATMCNKFWEIASPFRNPYLIAFSVADKSLAIFCGLMGPALISTLSVSGFEKIAISATIAILQIEHFGVPDKVLVIFLYFQLSQGPLFSCNCRFFLELFLLFWQQLRFLVSIFGRCR